MSSLQPSEGLSSSDEESYDLIDGVHHANIRSTEEKKLLKDVVVSVDTRDSLESPTVLTPTQEIEVCEHPANNAIDLKIPRIVTIEKGENGYFGLWNYGPAIYKVLNGGAAQRSGVYRGDQIISIDGISVETLSNDEISTLFERASVQGRITLELRYNFERVRDLETFRNREKSKRNKLTAETVHRMIDERFLERNDVKDQLNQLQEKYNDEKENWEEEIGNYQAEVNAKDNEIELLKEKLIEKENNETIINALELTKADLQEFKSEEDALKERVVQNNIAFVLIILCVNICNLYVLLYVPELELFPGLICIFSILLILYAVVHGRAATARDDKLKSLFEKVDNVLGESSVPSTDPALVPSAKEEATLNSSGDARTVQLARGKCGLFGFDHIDTFVSKVYEGWPAQQAGLRRGDINGINIENIKCLADEVVFKLLGMYDEVTLELRHNPEGLVKLEKEQGRE